MDRSSTLLLLEDRQWRVNISENGLLDGNGWRAGHRSY